MALYGNVLGLVTRKKRLWRLLGVVVGSFILALVYNAFVVPNNLVYGGMSGLAILINTLTGMSVTMFLNIVTFSLIVVSFIVLGFKKTSYALVGYVAYVFMINVTESIAPYFAIEFDSFLLSVFVYALVSGFGSGLIYRMGFNTGGSDSIISLVQHFFKMPTAKISILINTIIILLGTSVFGIEMTLYAIIFLMVSNFVSDRTILGTANSKLCYIRSKKNAQIEQMIKNDLHLGYTLLDYSNGVGFLKKKIIFCVIPSEMFYDFKKSVVEIDKNVLFISNNCYTVEGGTTNYLFPV